MNLADLFIAKKLAGGGGGGTGTDNYNDLSNKPQINSTALTGDKSASDLGLQSEIDSDNKISADYVDDTSTSNKFVSAAEKLEWSGKQDAIDADHKIDADYVDDTTSDNKFVTASDKTAWNAKQDKIDSSHKLSSDLVDDTGHTNLFVTSTEKSTWNGKQDKIDSSHKLSSTLVSFDSSEAAALASGIDSSKVGQISTNQTNILYVADQIGKNQLDTSLDALKAINTAGTWNGNVCTYSVGSVTVNSDGTLTVKKTRTASRLLFYLTENSGGSTPTSGTKYAGCVLSGCPSGGSENTYSQHGEQAQSPWGTVAAEYGNGYTIVTSSLPVYFYIVLNEAYTTPSDGLTFKPMICTADAWSISHEFEPYALPNYDLTRLEAEDRAALAEEIDAGAKNIAEIYNVAQNAITITTSGYKATFSGTASQDGSITWGKFHVNTTGDYVVYCNMSTSAGRFTVYNQTDSVILRSFYPTDNQTPVVLSLVAGKNYTVYSWFAAGTASACVIDLMICTKAAFCLSSAFVPYCKPLASKADHTYSLGSVDLNDVTKDGTYMCSPIANSPVSTVSFLQVYNDTSYDLKQVLQKLNEPSIIYIRHRRFNSGTPPYTWTAWYKFTGTVVS